MYDIIYVYNAANFDGFSTLLSSLNEDDDSFQMPPGCNETDVQRIVAWHREHSGETSNADPEHFLIVDRIPIETHGILLVNTNHHGYVDAVRANLEESKLFAASISIGNTDWKEARESAFDTRFDGPGTLLMPPPGNFAIYDIGLESEPILRQCIKTLNDGISVLDIDPDLREIYRGFRLSASLDLEQIKEHHLNHATDEQLDKQFFGIVDSRWSEGVVTLVNTADSGSTLESQLETRGIPAREILNWIWVGLLTWNGAKEQYK